MKKKLLCRVIGHQLKVVKKDKILLEEYTCTCCQKKFTTDGYGRIVRLSKYWEENNLLFERNFKNRTAI
ncbi:MAG: hypothetical protein R2793_08050 [Flavobacteriaceae bacterium]